MQAGGFVRGPKAGDASGSRCTQAQKGAGRFSMEVAWGPAWGSSMKGPCPRPGQGRARQSGSVSQEQRGVQTRSELSSLGKLDFRGNPSGGSGRGGPARAGRQLQVQTAQRQWVCLNRGLVAFSDVV